jgi:hypothetical protein
MVKTVAHATKILVIEDETPMVAMKAFLLMPTGSVVTMASSVEKTVWLAQTGTFETTPTA